MSFLFCASNLIWSMTHRHTNVPTNNCFVDNNFQHQAFVFFSFEYLIFTTARRILDFEVSHVINTIHLSGNQLRTNYMKDFLTCDANVTRVEDSHRIFHFCGLRIQFNPSLASSFDGSCEWNTIAINKTLDKSKIIAQWLIKCTLIDSVKRMIYKRQPVMSQNQ